ncbi:dnaJ homolog subfamily C member 28 isoform X3 [Tamandua tetradactyla]|uniref:dnaJ homolog subfamily C member 28 isoform X3 n=1 Tax=Tamandua tetradactyla TaxID=48850 RepID=UPI004054819A
MAAALRTADFKGPTPVPTALSNSPHSLQVTPACKATNGLVRRRPRSVTAADTPGKWSEIEHTCAELEHGCGNRRAPSPRLKE